MGLCGSQTGCGCGITSTASGADPINGFVPTISVSGAGTGGDPFTLEINQEWADEVAAYDGRIDTLDNDLSVVEGRLDWRDRGWLMQRTLNRVINDSTFITMNTTTLETDMIFIEGATLMSGSLVAGATGDADGIRIDEQGLYELGALVVFQSTTAAGNAVIRIEVDGVEQPFARISNRFAGGNTIKAAIELVTWIEVGVNEVITYDIFVNWDSASSNDATEYQWWGRMVRPG